MSIERFQLVMCLSLLGTFLCTVLSLHGLLLVPLTWPYIPYLVSIYY